MEYISWLEPHRGNSWQGIYVNEEQRICIDVAPASCFFRAEESEYSTWSVYAVCRKYRPLGQSTVYSCVKIFEPMVDIVNVVVSRTEANDGSDSMLVKWNKKTLSVYVPLVRTDDPRCKSMSEAIVGIAARNEQAVVPAYLHEVLAYVNKPRKKVFGLF